MADVLIRGLMEEDLVRIEKRSRALGISRVEFMRRVIAKEATRIEEPVTVADLERFAAIGADLLDEAIMDQAWQ